MTSSPEKSSLSPEQKKVIREILIRIFKDICFNNANILKAKNESDKISEEIRQFILGYIESGKSINEIDLLNEVREKGVELVENHELIFVEDKVDSGMKMRAFLIPGLKIEVAEEEEDQAVTEDDMQSVDHELCVSFRSKVANEFLKLGNLIDIRATLAKNLSNKSSDDQEIPEIISDNTKFKQCLEDSYYFAGKVV